MGTRNLTIVRSDKVIKVAQYGQWDGYPTGQGNTIAVFLRTVDEERFKQIVNSLEWYKEGEVEQLWKNIQEGKPSSNVLQGESGGFVTAEEAKEMSSLHPELSRDTGADILQLIYEGKIDKLDNEFEFIKDGLFCEYAYIVDLDKRVVEVYANNYVHADQPSGTDYVPLKDVPAPAKVLTFEDFKAEGAMAQLKKDLSEDED